jgi:ABC-type amino acid transport substrate-binding protein
VFLGGVLTEARLAVGAVRQPAGLRADPHRSRPPPSSRAAPGRPSGLDIPGAVLSAGDMLLLVYTLVQAPDQGWGSIRTIGVLANAAVVLAAFAVTELRRREPLFPFSILRVRGRARCYAKTCS